MISSNNHSLIEKKIGAADSRPKNQENDWSIPEIFFYYQLPRVQTIGRVGAPRIVSVRFQKEKELCFRLWTPHGPRKKRREQGYGHKAPHCSTPCKHSRPPGPCAPSPSTFRPLAPVHLLKALFGPLAPCALIPKRFGSLAPCFNPEHISASLAPVLPPEAPWPRPRASSVLWWSWIYTHAVKIKPIYGEIHTIRKLHWINAPRAYIFICMIEPWRGLSPVIF